MKTNRPLTTIRTHEGAVAKHVNPEAELRRSLMACMLWENSFYESGEDIAKRLAGLVPKVGPDKVADMAREARTDMKLRHAPLLVTREMARYATHRPFVRRALNDVIQRADEPAEFLSMYWKDGRCPIAKQVRLGLADSLNKFNEYQFAKYNRDGAVKLRDVLFMSHAKPKNGEQAALFKKITDDTLKTPDTWEVALSGAGPEADKAAIWTRLLKENKLGALALMRNLRNMIQAGVPRGWIGEAISQLDPSRVLPFRFITAARHAPKFEPELEQAMLKSLQGLSKLPGVTTLLVDVSGSMDATLSSKSEVSRVDAASGLAIMLRERCEIVNVATFSENVVEIPARRGFALRDAIAGSQVHGGTYLGAAIKIVQERLPADRLIVVTDEQSHDTVPDPKGSKNYMINVATYKNGVGYGPWTHIDGWSESVVDYIVASEG